MNRQPPPSSGRPPGEIRQALRSAAEALAELHGGCTWRDAAQAACVGFAAARQTMENMERAGELVRVDTRRVQGVCRPMIVYAPKRRRSWVMGGASSALGQVLNGWCREPAG